VVEVVLVVVVVPTAVVEAAALEDKFHSKRWLALVEVNPRLEHREGDNKIIIIIISSKTRESNRWIIWMEKVT
jgi:hypothetical protein